MNIVKLKDVIMPDTATLTPGSPEHYNKYIKGKYAYWIGMRYIVSLDIDIEKYSLFENDIQELLDSGIPYYDISELENWHCEWQFAGEFIDIEETNRVNSIQQFIFDNGFTTDGDITIDELKKFRTWLADTLLKMDNDPEEHPLYDDITKHMLIYYKEHMYDDVVKWLSTLTQRNISFQTVQKSCGCCGNADLSSLYNTSLSTCDPVADYKTSIYNIMVATFSDLYFWNTKGEMFLKEFKKYIDNIIKINLPLTSSYNSDFQDCGCRIQSAENNYKFMLQNLSEALEYIINKKIDTHRLFIGDALSAWAKNLYEFMEW